MSSWFWPVMVLPMSCRGASRGIGLAIGLRAAKDGANVVLVAKTTEENPKLPGTIFSGAKGVTDVAIAAR